MAELPALADLPDPVARRRSLQELGDAAAFDRDVALAFLFDALGDEDYAVRHAAVGLASRWAGTVGTQALERALCDESSLARRSAAMEAFGQLGAAAVPALERVARDVNSGLRRLAVDALGLTRARAAYEPLSRLCDDVSPAVRAAALEGLSRVAGTAAAARVAEVCARRDEPASVVLSGLLALDAMEHALPPASIKPHLADPLTAAPALRLLGRAGEPGPLVDVLQKARGGRARAAAVGLSLALERNPVVTRQTLHAARAELEAPLIALIEGRDMPAAGAALQLAGAAGFELGLLHAARRDDRGLLLGAAHRAVRALAGGGKAEPRLRALKGRAEDDETAAFFDELIEGAAEGLGESAPAVEPKGAPPERHPGAAGATVRLSPEEFTALAEMFHRVAGLQFEPHTAYRLEARLLPRLRTHKLTSWARYLALLEAATPAGREELTVALDRVTVHETYFFRERYQLDEFSGRVLPALKGRDRRGVDELLHVESGPVRVLSAGCSTGEEAWTLAILLERSGLFRADGFEVVGIDISPSSVEAARRGVYGRRGFRGDAPDGVLDDWFEERGAQRAVKDSLRERVRFTLGNLTDPNDLAPLGRFHVVFCRNVMIYMSDEARARVIGHFRERLWPGGVLFLGHSESLLNMDTGFRFLPLDRESVYVRPREGTTS